MESNKKRFANATNLENLNPLKVARISKGMTQQQVADSASINIRHYQMFESMERDIKSASFSVAMAVCKALEIAPESLMVLL